MFTTLEEYEKYLQKLSLEQLVDIYHNIDGDAYPERFNLVKKYRLCKESEEEAKRKVEKPKKRTKTASLRNGFALIKDLISTLLENPGILFPLIFCWLIIATLVTYLEFFFPWDNYALGGRLLILFIVLLLYSFVFSFSCLILLELIKQNESGRPVHLLTATLRVVTVDLVRALPITFIWAILWFVLSILEAIFSRKTLKDKEFTVENVAATLAGFEDIPLSEAFFAALEKGLRMIVFLILPAIAWENFTPFKSIKKGLVISKEHLGEFMTGFVLTEMAAACVFLPPAIIFILWELHVPIHDYIWFATILYCMVAWSFSMFMEQMFSAGLYLWHLKWEDACCVAKTEGREIPNLEDIKRPIIMDNVPDLMNLSRNRITMAD